MGITHETKSAASSAADAADPNAHLSITDTLDRAAHLEQCGSEADWAAQLKVWDVEVRGTADKRRFTASDSGGAGGAGGAGNVGAMRGGPPYRVGIRPHSSSGTMHYRDNNASDGDSPRSTQSEEVEGRGGGRTPLSARRRTRQPGDTADILVNWKVRLEQREGGGRGQRQCWGGLCTERCGT